MSKFAIAKLAVETCSSQNLLDPELLNSLTKAEQLSFCLNNELAVFGVETFVSPDKSTVLIDDQSMKQTLNFLENKGFQPEVTKEKIEAVKDLINAANQNKVSLIWKQEGFKSKYYQFKQLGFNGINLLNLLNVNTLATAGVALSPTGAVGLSVKSAIALSWSGTMFLSTLDNFIPNSFTRTKAVIKISKWTFGIPIIFVEYTANAMLGFGEELLIGNQLPINVTSEFDITQGPKLKDITRLKKPLGEFLRKNIEKYLLNDSEDE